MCGSKVVCHRNRPNDSSSVLRTLINRTFTCIAFALLVVQVVGCNTSDAIQEPATVEQLLDVDLTSVDPDVKEFLKSKQDSVRSRPHQALTIGQLGMAYEMNGFADRALLAYQLASQIGPKDPEWPYYAALLEASKGEYVRAINEIEESIARDPEYFSSWLWRGQWHLDLEHLDLAEESFMTAINLGAGVSGEIGLVQVIIRKGDYQQAKSELQSIRSEYDNEYIDFLVFRVDQRVETIPSTDYDESIPRAASPPNWEDKRSEIKRQYEVSLSASLERYRNMIEQDAQNQHATDLINELVQKYPDNERVMVSWLYHLRLQNQLGPQVSRLSEAIQTWPENPVLNSLMAEQSINSEQFEEGREYLNIALKQDPNNSSLLAQRGLVYIELDQLDLATQDFHKSNAIDPRAEVHFYLGNVLASQSDWSRAVCQFQHALKLDPALTAAQEDLERARQFIEGSELTECSNTP